MFEQIFAGHRGSFDYFCSAVLHPVRALISISKHT